MSERILITGASGGIGSETALYLSENGFDVVLHYNRNAENVKKIQNEIGGNTQVLQFDISNRAECCEVLSSDIEKNGSYYGIVLNAGISRDNIFPLMSENEWDSVINTNLSGFYNVLKPVMMPMITSKIKGRIVAVSSVSGLAGNRGQVNYSASKAGLIGAAKALSLEVAKRGITVNCIAPGVIETDMIKGLPLDEITKIIPMKRAGTAREVASLINYLMSKDAGYITGQVISVNGGMYR